MAEGAGSSVVAWLGVVVTILAFHVDKADSYPALQAFLAPSYVSAKRGIERIQKKGSLQVGEPDFAAVAKLVEAAIAPQNPTAEPSTIVLERLEVTHAGTKAYATGTRQVVGMNMIFRGQTKATEGDLLELGEIVEGTWKTKSLRLSRWLFWIGIALIVWPLLPVKWIRWPVATVGS